jgi:hypothetical protein
MTDNPQFAWSAHVTLQSLSWQMRGNIPSSGVIGKAPPCTARSAPAEVVYKRLVRDK